METTTPKWVLVLFLVLAISTTAAELAETSQAEPARPAPAFDLPLLNGHGYINSDGLFPARAHTFLVFWDSNCPHCVESLLQCESFYEEQTTDEVAVVGIHPDRGELSDVQQLLEANGIFFPQLWDMGGEAGQDYSISFATFSVFLVDRRGSIVARQHDPQGDMQSILEEMLANVTSETVQPEEAGAAPAPKESTPDAPSARFVFSADQRLRFLSIDSRGAAAAGPYGEQVEPGNHVFYRFDFEISRRISRHLRAGGLLRLSNEGKKVLESGPRYLGSEWGSAFAEVNADGLSLRLGYYDIAMTPLTLMRWDWSDNPRIGGTAGCGCAAAAGVLLVESLEELGPELVFEGGATSCRRWGLETRAFYAMPRRARKTLYREVRSTGTVPADYSLEIYGAESSWRRHDSRTGAFWKAGARLVGSWENRRSVDFFKLGYPASYPWSSSTIASADWYVPLIRSVGFEGEWILWNKSRERNPACCDTLPTTEGKGGMIGVSFERSSGLKARCDYIYLDQDFHSLFAALSYEPNREGFRFSAEVPLAPEKIASASIFYKRVREVESGEAEKAKYSFFGAAIDLELPSGWGGVVGGMENGSWRTGDVDRFDEERRVLVVGARYRFDKASLIQIQYQRVSGRVEDDHFVETGYVEKDALSNLYSVYLNTRF